MAVLVNVDNFVRAETDRMFTDLQRDAGGVNRLLHNREPASVDRQTVIRLNRDTLYSFAVVDVSAGAVLILPEHGDRYLSAMIVDRDHYVTEIHHDAGTYRLTADTTGSPYVLVAVRILVDPADPNDVRAVADIQDGVMIDSASTVPFSPPGYDTASLDKTRSALLELANGLTGFDETFGRPDQVDPVRHLIGTAAGWGGLPSDEAAYIGVAPNVPSGCYELTLRDVPVDGFWSVSVYNAAGYFEPNTRNLYSVNSITGVPNNDGSVTVRFGDFPNGTPNAIPTTDGWNFLVRLYRPRAAISDGTWQLPELRPAR
ncbi:DUF1214 domain-containing protein [Prescottella subtropica]|uniref:DUF1214 domain-containing protein n=1 Tax=Prescottella subtropica TaxID=2545757 RepID=UPI0010F937E4|nr:DUF1214 domain-containing protein [Prescottella subtropica]